LSDYYSRHLAGERLRLVYDIAPPRVRQYLSAEIEFVRARVRPSDVVLELGCGYGRVLGGLLGLARQVVGIDTSCESLKLARRVIGVRADCELYEMDALDLRFPDGRFDLVFCVQNGIAAFGVDELALMKEAVRVTRPGGLVLFSSYSERFWDWRLQWFRLQAARGLVGEIDDDESRDGVIVCRDGLRAGAVTPERFMSLAGKLGITPVITEVDGSSVFCELRRGAEGRPGPPGSGRV
jgi:2-polyprenyl-6-hydroxyphenyl methylase/3-demethylubiquinone-9 3-methyltransferase